MYQIITDSAMDMPTHVFRETGIYMIPMSYEIDKETFLYSADSDPALKQQLYQAMREKKVASTTQITPFQYEQVFRTYLDEGKDVLYLCFSSGITSTYDSALIAQKTLQEEYPDRKIICVDTKCCAAGLGLLVYDVVQLQKAGKSIEEAEAYVHEHYCDYAHFFMVNDLMYLVRGGRISKAAGIAGSALGMKPLMLMNEEGKLEVFQKARGVKGAIKRMVELMKIYAASEDTPCWIIHSGDGTLAQQVKDKMVAEGFTGTIELIEITPIVGAHVGPDFFAIFYRAKDVGCRHTDTLKALHA